MKWTKEDSQRTFVWALMDFFETFNCLKEIAEENEVDSNELWKCWAEQKEARRIK